MLKGLLPLIINLAFFGFFALSIPKKRRRRKSKLQKTDWASLLAYLTIEIAAIMALLGMLGQLSGSNLGGHMGKLLSSLMVYHYGWLTAVVSAVSFAWLSLLGLFGKLTSRKVSNFLWLNILAFLLTTIWWSVSVPAEPASPWSYAKFVVQLFPTLSRAGVFIIASILTLIVLRIGFSVKMPSKLPKWRLNLSSAFGSMAKLFGELVSSVPKPTRTGELASEEKPSASDGENQGRESASETSTRPPSSQTEIIIYGEDGVKKIISTPHKTDADEHKPVETGGSASNLGPIEAQASILDEINVPFDRLLTLLNRGDGSYRMDEKELRQNARLIEEKLEEFGVRGRVVGYHPGPVVTRYEYELAPGIKLSKITNLADDLALRMKTHQIRIVAPLANKGLIGIEVPNRKRSIVYLRELLEKKEFKEKKHKLVFALGVDTGGKPFYTNLARMPHLLIAGATGSGKSVSINTIISSFLFRARPSELRMLLIDPKRIELSYYEGVPHLLLPVVKDRKFAGSILKQAVMWMDLRYKHFARDGVRDIESHNRSAAARGDRPLPYIVIIIDEFADLILTIGKEVEEPLARLAQMARAVGIHLIVATQRPSVDVITGIIKANFPVRVAFKVPSKVDSRTILDEIGAEKLLGLGDMLFIPPGSSEPIRLHGPFVSEEETRQIAHTYTRLYLANRLRREFEGAHNLSKFVNSLIDNGLISALTRDDEPGSEERFQIALSMFSNITGVPSDKAEIGLKKIRSSYYIPIPEMKETAEQMEREAPIIEGLDPLIKEAIKLATARGEVSATMLQRKLRVGFARAARIIDQMEELGIVTPQEGSRPRRVMMSYDEAMQLIKGV